MFILAERYMRLLCEEVFIDESERNSLRTKGIIEMRDRSVVI